MAGFTLGVAGALGLLLMLEIRTLRPRECTRMMLFPELGGWVFASTLHLLS